LGHPCRTEEQEIWIIPFFIKFFLFNKKFSFYLSFFKNAYSRLTTFLLFYFSETLTFFLILSSCPVFCFLFGTFIHCVDVYSSTVSSFFFFMIFKKYCSLFNYLCFFKTCNSCSFFQIFDYVLYFSKALFIFCFFLLN
jgi:hypothetical protein